MNDDEARDALEFVVGEGEGLLLALFRLLWLTLDHKTSSGTPKECGRNRGKLGLEQELGKSLVYGSG